MIRFGRFASGVAILWSIGYPMVTTAFSPPLRTVASVKTLNGLQPGNHVGSLSRRNMIPIESSSILSSAIEYFDGSQIVDPVVVSNVFWDSLQSRLLSFIVGQVAAVAVFALVVTVASPQITKAGEWVSAQIFNKPPPTGRVLIRPKRSSTQSPDLFRLLLCVAIDIIGSASELVPLLGEVTDVVWAPIAALLLRSLYGGSNVILVLEFAEEILPFTDILPLATICWVVDTFLPESDLAKLLQLGAYRANVVDRAVDAIDVEISNGDMKQLSTPKSKSGQVENSEISKDR